MVPTWDVNYVSSAMKDSIERVFVWRDLCIVNKVEALDLF